MREIPSLVGQRFGRLSPIEEIRELKTSSHRFYRCRCECGKIVIVTQAHLRSGHSASCGCLLNDINRARLRTHGHTPKSGWSSEYRIWSGMKYRCMNVTCPAYKDYGGRGIRVHPQWISSFEQFFHDVGPRPSPRHTLDRINNDGNYEPGNVRWATWHQQRVNSRPRPWEKSRRKLKSPPNPSTQIC